MSNEKYAIQFGAGNIGRGFIALLLSQSGYKLTFADVQQAVVDEINARGEYTVEVLGRNWAEITVSPVRACHSDSPDIIREIADAQLITTAVGPNILKFVAPVIAKGITARRRAGVVEPLNVIACENMIGGSSALAELVYAELAEEDAAFAKEHVGFPNAAVDRIIPPGQAFDDLLRVRVEEFSEWIVDQGGFVGPVPSIDGMIPTDNLAAYLERKLFTLNTGHAACAYLGARLNYRTIGEAISDQQLKETVRQAMLESGEVLIRRYNFDRQQHLAYIDTILERFANPALVDKIARVGRQPLRKLGRDERLVKPLRGTLEYATSNQAIIQVIAAALCFRNPDDPQSVELASLLVQKNLMNVLEHITGLNQNQTEKDSLQAIAEAYEKLSMDMLMEEYLRRRTHVVSVQDAGGELPQLVDEALSGTEVILAHRGLPMVRLIPIGNVQSGMLNIANRS